MLYRHAIALPIVTLACLGSPAVAQTARLLGDLNTSTAPSMIGPGPSLGEGSANIAYFTVYDSVNGADLWRTDGTPGGTVLLGDFQQPRPDFFGLAGDTAYFVSNSTLLGTTGDPGVFSVFPNAFQLPFRLNSETFLPHARVGSTLFFAGRTSPQFRDTLLSITPSGTITSLYTSTGFQQSIYSIAATPTRVFAASLPGSGFAPLLVVTDGVSQATTVHTFTGAFSVTSSSFGWLTPAGESVYFLAPDTQNRRQVWVTNGTDPGTVQLTSFASTFAQPISPTWTGSRLAFLGPQTASAGGPPYYLWTSNGTPATTARTSLTSSIYMSNPTGFTQDMPRAPITVVNGQLAFITDPTGSNSLRIGDGGATSTAISTGTWFPVDFIGVTGTTPNQIAYFAGAMAGPRGRLWRTDGTPSGTFPINATPEARSSDSVRPLAIMGSRFIFGIQSLTTLTWSVWITDGTDAGTTQLIAPFGATTSASSSPTSLTAFGSQAIFGAASTANGVERFRAIGPAGSATVCEESVPGPDTSQFPQFTPAGGRLYSIATKRAVVNGTETNVDSLVVTTNPATLGQTLYLGQSIGELRYPAAFNDHLLFAGPAGSSTAESTLWMSDGTPGGTGPVASPGPSYMKSPYLPPVMWGNRAYVLAGDTAGVGVSLWSTDGTDAGTQEIIHLNSSGPGSVLSLVPASNRLYLIAPDASGTVRAWVSDGTAIGTRVIDATITALGSATIYQDALFLTGSTGANEYDLWKTAPGDTSLLPVAIVGTGSIPLTSLTVAHVPAGDRLFFAGTNSQNGTELWVSDGTTNGTFLVADVWPGKVLSNPAWLTPVSDQLVFVAGSPDMGRELWSTDGTLGGLRLLADINPGVSSSNPSNLIAIDGVIYMSAYREDVGREPFAIRMVTCPADVNHDDRVDSQDFFDFLTAFFAASPTADFNHDGSVNSQDFFDFLGAFFTPC